MPIGFSLKFREEARPKIVPFDSSSKLFKKCNKINIGRFRRNFMLFTYIESMIDIEKMM